MNTDNSVEIACCTLELLILLAYLLNTPLKISLYCVKNGVSDAVEVSQFMKTESRLKKSVTILLFIISSKLMLIYEASESFC